MFSQPKHAELIILGSNFEKTGESNWQFLLDLKGKGLAVDVYSIDKRPMQSDEPLSYEVNGIKVIRLNMDITEENISKKVVDEIPKSENKKIILIDSIDFDKPFSDLYQLTLTELSKKFDTNQVYSLHYISPLFANPTINKKPLSLDMLKELGINVADFIPIQPDKSDKSFPLFNMLRQLSKFKPDEANNMFAGVLEGIRPLNLDPNVRTEFKIWLNNQITSHLNLEKLSKLEEEYKVQPKKELI